MDGGVGAAPPPSRRRTKRIAFYEVNAEHPHPEHDGSQLLSWRWRDLRERASVEASAGPAISAPAVTHRERDGFVRLRCGGRAGL